MSVTFKKLSDYGDRPSLAVSQEAIDLLESITPVEKALSVPYVRIWRVDPKTSKPVSPHPQDPERPRQALSVQLVTPPEFGSSVDRLYSERPPVSLERISTKVAAPNGVLTYTTMEMSFVVHRPDVIFGDREPDVDNWSDIIIPGNVFVLEYGWSAPDSGVKNGILNGHGAGDPPFVVKGRSLLRFVVVNYSFKVQNDGQIPFTVSAYEDGDYALRGALVSHQTFVDAAAEAAKIRERERDGRRVEPQVRKIYDEAGRKVMKSFQDRVAQLTAKEHLVPLKDKRRGVLFSDLLDILVAPTVEEVLSELGYRKVLLLLGDFNRNVGLPNDDFDLRRSGPAGRGTVNIGDMVVSTERVTHIVSKEVMAGGQITFETFIAIFLGLLNNPDTWDRSKGKDDRKTKDVGPRPAGSMTQLPEVKTRTVLNPATGTATITIFDWHNEILKLSESSAKFSPATPRAEIREFLRNKGVPFVSFMRGNSYIQNATFDVVNDEQMKGILMRRAFSSTRGQLQEPSIKSSLDREVEPAELLYSSALVGDVTMLGNFVFDMFGLVWVDFGIPRWNGLFTMDELEHTIERGNFTTRVKLRSTGDDPLGTQGREKRPDLSVDAVSGS